MKIAVIGSGIIGYVASLYLSENDHEVDCISPVLENVKFDNLKNKSQKFNYQKPVSPKFNKPEFVINKYISDKYYPKNISNFVGLELVNEIGLARYWGANLALNALKNDLSDLNLKSYEKEALNRYIPKLDVQKFYNSKLNLLDSKFKKENKKIKYSKLPNYFYPATLSIFEDKVDMNKLPDDRPHESIFGNKFKVKGRYNRINSKVDKILFSKNGDSPTIVLSDNRELKYDYIIVACGAIGSYRLILNSLSNRINIDFFSRLKHHPLASTVCLAPKISYPRKFIAMSNFDFKFQNDDGSAYLNFFPLLGALKAILRNKDGVFWEIFKRFVKKLFKFLYWFPDYPLFPMWWIHRLYVANIYYQGEFSASFINQEKGLLNIIGGFRFDFEKVCFQKLYPAIVRALFKENFLTLLFKPLLAETGADLHYASSLSNLVDDNGLIKKSVVNEDKVIIIDSSSSEFLPNPNPTYYFVARAIKLLRLFQK